MYEVQRLLSGFEGVEVNFEDIYEASEAFGLFNQRRTRLRLVEHDRRILKYFRRADQSKMEFGLYKTIENDFFRFMIYNIVQNG